VLSPGVQPEVLRQPMIAMTKVPRFGRMDGLTASPADDAATVDFAFDFSAQPLMSGAVALLGRCEPLPQRVTPAR
jgi:hypothetical protein